MVLAEEDGMVIVRIWSCGGDDLRLRLNSPVNMVGAGGGCWLVSGCQGAGLGRYRMGMAFELDWQTDLATKQSFQRISIRLVSK